MNRNTARRSTGLHLALAMGLMLLGAGVASATPITYQVNQTIGTGSVVGTITTDGALGVLLSADITDWDLMLTGLNASKTLNLTKSNSQVVVFGTDLTATATNLFFDFGAASTGYLLIQAPPLGSGAQYYCDAAKLLNFWCSPGASVVPGSVVDNPQTYEYVLVDGKQIIGTVPGGVSTVPDAPATFLLMGLGLAAIRVMRARKAG